MERAITPASWRGSAGFTLIELLVTVAVLAVLAVGVSLSVGRSGSRGQDDQALFRDQYEAARRLAVTGQQPRGLRIEASGLRLSARSPEGWHEGGALLRWRERVAFTARAPRPLPPGTPEIVLLPNGRGTAFDIAFRAERGIRHCESDGWTGLTCDGD